MDRERRAGGERVYSDELPSVSEDSSYSCQLAAKGYIVAVAGHNTMVLVEVGPPFLPAVVVFAANARAVIKSERCLRLLVERLSKCVSAQEAKVVGKPLLYFGL